MTRNGMLNVDMIKVLKELDRNTLLGINGECPMKYSETEIKKLLKTKDLSLEDQVKVNILNFIRTIHLNEEDFMNHHMGQSSLEYFYDL